MVDTIQLIPYSMTDQDVKLTDSSFDPPHVFSFKMSPDEKTLVGSDGVILQLQ